MLLLLYEAVSRLIQLGRKGRGASCTTTKYGPNLAIVIYTLHSESTSFIMHRKFGHVIITFQFFLWYYSKSSNLMHPIDITSMVKLLFVRSITLLLVNHSFDSERA